MKYQCVTVDFPTDPSPKMLTPPDLEKQPKTWTFSDWSVNRIPMVPKPPRANWHLTPTYLLCALTRTARRQPKRRGPYRAGGSKYLSVTQATNIIEAVNFAKLIGLPLVAHATIHWSGTIAFDDPDGIRFAKVREGLSKVFVRRASLLHGPGPVSANPTPTSCTAICFFTCLLSTARVQSSTRSKRP